MRKSLVRLSAQQNEGMIQQAAACDQGNVERHGLRCIAKCNK